MNTRARTILSAVFALLAIFLSEDLLAGVGEWTSSGPSGVGWWRSPLTPTIARRVRRDLTVSLPNSNREAAQTPCRNTSEALARS